jgi:hypothetical protein
MALSFGERAGAGPSIPRHITGPWTKMFEELPIGSENALANAVTRYMGSAAFLKAHQQNDAETFAEMMSSGHSFDLSDHQKQDAWTKLLKLCPPEATSEHFDERNNALCTFERRILDEAQLMEQQVQAHYVPVKRKAVDAFANNEEFQGAEGPARMKALLTRVQDSLQRDKRGSAVDWIPKRLANHDAIKFDDIAPKGLMSSHISCASHAPHACAGSLKIKNYCVLKVLPCHACMVTYAAFSPCCVCGPT